MRGIILMAVLMFFGSVFFGCAVNPFEAYQKDADVIRLRHLKYLGGIVEEYKMKTGKYPLQGETKSQNYVFIVNTYKSDSSLSVMTMSMEKAAYKIIRQSITDDRDNVVSSSSNKKIKIINGIYSPAVVKGNVISYNDPKQIIINTKTTYQDIIINADIKDSEFRIQWI